jgi:hypothetical protein
MVRPFSAGRATIMLGPASGAGGSSGAAQLDQLDPVLVSKVYICELTSYA